MPPKFREETSCSRQSHAALQYKGIPWTYVKAAVKALTDGSADINTQQTYAVRDLLASSIAKGSTAQAFPVLK